MTPARRANAYLAQTGRRELTPRQRRRLQHKVLRRSRRLPDFGLSAGVGVTPNNERPTT